MMTAQQYNRRQQERSFQRGLDVEFTPRKGGILKRAKNGLSAKDKKRLLLLVAVIGFICICMIITSAYVASVTYSNNILRSSNTALQGEVESLQIQIDVKDNITAVESKASGDLSMVYPTGKSYVKLSSVSADKNNFAGLLKKQAFD